MPRFSLIPKDAKFFDLFERSVANLEVAARELADFLQNYEDVPNKVARFKEMEHQGDVLTHQIMEQLHRTFVTPLDREDISLLAQKLDDVLDFMEGAVSAMHLYHIDRPTPRAQELAAILVAMTKELGKAIPCLRHGAQMKQILAHCVEINRLENEADDVMRSALTELFDGTPLIDVIKWREIYEHLETASDRGEDVANVLEGIVLKHA